MYINSPRKKTPIMFISQVWYYYNIKPIVELRSSGEYRGHPHLCYFEIIAFKDMRKSINYDLETGVLKIES